MSKSKGKAVSANASKGVQAANVTDISFDTLAAHGILTTMAEAVGSGEEAKQAKENASLAFCIFAVTTMATNEGRDRGTITEGFTKGLDAMRQMLAAEGNRFVEIKDNGKDKEPTYSWKGHGNNVKSIAKGVTEFFGVDHTDEDGAEIPAMIDPRDAESFTEVKKSVEAARQYGEDEDKRLLREAKDALRESAKLYVSEVIKSTDIGLITDARLELEHLLSDWLADCEAQEALDTESQKIVIPETALTGDSEAAAD